MFNLGPLELVAIFVVALLVFGPEKLPEIGKQIGRGVSEFRKFQATMQANVRDVMEPIAGPIQNAMQDNVDSVRDAVGPITGQIMGPVMTNGPSSNGPNIPRSATVQSPEPPEGEDTPAPGTFGHYAPVEPPAPADPGGETPPTSSTDPAAG